MKRWHAIAPVVFAAAAFVSVFSVRPTDDGFALMYRWNSQASECDDGGGCYVLSARQISGVAMRILQDMAGAAREPQQRQNSAPNRSDI